MKIPNFLSKFMWIPLSENKTPKWVKNASFRYKDKCSVRPYDRMKYFKGKSFIYKVFYECVGQSRIKEHYYKKQII